MKLSLALSIVLSVPAIGYSPMNIGKSSSKLKKQSPSALNYIDSRNEGADMINLDNLFVVTKDDPSTAVLAAALGVSDSMVRTEYSNWLKKFDKVADESRYATFKKNWLVQEDYNRKVDVIFALNKYADCTEEEYLQRQINQAVAVETHRAVDETMVQPQLIEQDIEVIDDDILAKYEAIESVEERAFKVLEFLGFISKPASISYIDEIPELRINGKTYLEALGNPDNSAITGPSTFQSYVEALGNVNDSAITGPSTIQSYLDKLPASKSSTFARGKTGITLGATTSYLDDICALIEPFLNSEEGRATVARKQPRSPEVEGALQSKYGAIKNLGDRAFQILVDLCMVGKCGEKYS